MDLGPVGIALVAGVVAAFNPCGFAMLPAYVSYYVGASGDEPAPLRDRLLRAALTGLSVSAGFMALFGVVGFVLSELTSRINTVVPWVSMVIGVALVVLGVAMLRGYEPKLALPRVGRAASGRGLRPMFLYGVSYGTVSLSCTLPVFVTTVVASLRRRSVLAGVSTYLSYALGMSVVLVLLSFAVAVGQQQVVRAFRRALPHVNRVSALLLLAAGAYVAWYGYYEVRLQRGDDVAGGPVDWVSNWSARIQTFVTDRIGVGGILVGLVLVASLVTAAVVARGRGPRVTPGQPADTPPHTDGRPSTEHEGIPQHA